MTILILTTVFILNTVWLSILTHEVATLRVKAQSNARL